MTTWYDRAVAFVADPSGGSDYARQKETEQTLIAGYEKILNDPNISPEKRLKTEKLYANFRGTPLKDPAANAGKVFVDTAADTGKQIAKNSLGFVSDTFLGGIPVWVVVLVLATFAVWLRFKK